MINPKPQTPNPKRQARGRDGAGPSPTAPLRQHGRQLPVLYRAHPSYQTQVKRSETAALDTARSVSDHRRGRGVQAEGVRGCSNRCVWQVDSIVIAKVDATANDPPAHVVVDSFPTILLWKAGAGPSQTPVKFDG